MNISIIPYDLIPKGGNCPIDNSQFICELAVALENICEKNEGIGISAVQVGIPFNFFIVKFKDGYRYFVNCDYEPLDKVKEKSIEGCLSLKDEKGNLKYYKVNRFKNIRVYGMEFVPPKSFITIDIKPSGIYGIVVQHEIDHKNQILISDIGRRVFKL